MSTGDRQQDHATAALLADDALAFRSWTSERGIAVNTVKVSMSPDAESIALLRELLELAAVDRCMVSFGAADISLYFVRHAEYVAFLGFMYEFLECLGRIADGTE